MAKTRIAIIGTGGIAGAHVKSYLRMDDVEIVAGADIVKGKARKFLDANGLKQAKDFLGAKEMLEAVKPDAVSICTYNSTHPRPLTVSATSFDYFGKSPKYNTKKDAARFSVDDFCGAFIRLEGGVTMDFRMSWAMHMDSTGATIFLGTEAGLKVEPAGYGEMWGGAWDGSCGSVTLFHDYLGTPTHTPIPLPVPKEDNFFLKCRSFVDAVQKRLPAPIPTGEIIYNQAIIDGIIRSSASGREVSVEFKED